MHLVYFVKKMVAPQVTGLLGMEDGSLWKQLHGNITSTPLMLGSGGKRLGVGSWEVLVSNPNRDMK